MSFPSGQWSFAAGEIAPDLFGRVDLNKYKTGCSTLRNFFVSYRGPAYSRAGTRFTGQCKQPFGVPPTAIPFSFSTTQAYVIEAGDRYFRFVFQGGYVTEPTKSISTISNTNPGTFTSAGHGYAVGDWVQLADVGGMPQISGQIYTIFNPTTNTFQIKNTLTGQTISTSSLAAYTGGGTVARIYTLDTPYAVADLPYLKWTQSADVMSLTCVNTATRVEYPPYDLKRLGNANWTLTLTTFASSIAAPGSASATASNTTSSTTSSTEYQYVVTAIDSITAEESVASPIATITNSIDIAVVAGTNTVSWDPVTGASSYNIYRAPPAYNAAVPVGSLFGFAGQAVGTSFADTNITVDASKTPPTHQNPFARSAIAAVVVTSGGTGYDQTTVGYTITTATGTGAVLTPIVVGDAIVAVIVVNGGEDYAPADTIAFTGGTGATGTLTLGAATGTYPSTVSYFQQRRWYADTLNNPDTYYGSQPGAFTNMDSSLPITDSDAIVGSPWAQQVDGIQWMVQMPGGLVILTGRGAWQLSGGALSTAVTPSNQFATPQAYNGCSALVRPITINYDILYVQEKGSIIRDLSYNFFANIYTGTDLTVLSNHLFTGYTIVRWDWAEEPYKLAWAIRNDGTLLSLTYLKEQDIYAWARHDTNGLFISVACVSEPPVNAVYFIVARRIWNNGNPIWAYYMERMDNRLWTNLDASDVWCVDCGLALTQPTPAAVLYASEATGAASIDDYTIVAGGAGYTAPIATVEDAGGAGSGAQATLTVSGGVVVGYAVLAVGSGYVSPQVLISDATGTGAVVAANISNIIGFAASAAVFGSTQIGDVVRSGGGIAVVTAVLSTVEIEANLLRPITATIPNDPMNTPVPQQPGAWSITTPTDTLHGLDYIEGMTVSILGDGGVMPQQVVRNGAVTLPVPVTSAVVGLPFTAQMQTLYLETGQQPTVQGRRKTLYGCSVRVVGSRGWSVGANQPDASTQMNQADVPWTNMVEVPQWDANDVPGLPLPLFTGDSFIVLMADSDTKGQVALQQANPLPLQVAAVIPWIEMGDSVSVGP